MKFIEMEHLKPGMRLARPIYNKKGVLLVERGTGLTQQNIDNVKYFGLLGVYVLEPAEPLPPMSDEDKEYERFQISTGFVINEELGKIISGKKQIGIYQVASAIQKNFGHMDKKLNFYQNPASKALLTRFFLHEIKFDEDFGAFFQQLAQHTHHALTL